jgi:hypothetical protein
MKHFKASCIETVTLSEISNNMFNRSYYLSDSYSPIKDELVILFLDPKTTVFRHFHSTDYSDMKE